MRYAGTFNCKSPRKYDLRYPVWHHSKNKYHQHNSNDIKVKDIDYTGSNIMHSFLLIINKWSNVVNLRVIKINDLAQASIYTNYVCYSLRFPSGEI